MEHNLSTGRSDKVVNLPVRGVDGRRSPFADQLKTEPVEVLSTTRASRGHPEDSQPPQKSRVGRAIGKSLL
jgi:hypothetical protein